MKSQFVIMRHTTGKKLTHNLDAYFRRVWRLLRDGTVERTTSYGNGYKLWMEGETIPSVIIDAAKKAGIAIKPGRRKRKSYRSGSVSDV